MSAWEVTEEDVKQVLDAHGVAFSGDIYDIIDADDVEERVLSYVDFDNQVAGALSEIEDQLIKAEVVSEVKKFNLPDFDEDFKDEWEEE